MFVYKAAICYPSCFCAVSQKVLSPRLQCIACLSCGDAVADFNSAHRNILLIFLARVTLLYQIHSDQLGLKKTAV